MVKQLEVVMRRVYRAGEKLLVDYAGPSQHAISLTAACDQFDGPIRYRSVPARC